jgi:transposase-like protein
MARPVLSDPIFHNEEAAFEYVEAHLWPEGPVCPHCGAPKEKIGAIASGRAGLRKCYQCRKTFTVRNGSIFEDSHFPLHLWLQAIYLMCSSKKGISTRQLQRTFQCSMKTAWFLSHRIREIMKRDFGLFTAPMGGEGKFIEADETYVGRKPGTKVRRGAGHKNAVVALVERDGEVRSFHVPNVLAETLRSVIATHASRKSHLRTDELPAYTGIGWNFASHETVKHSADEYVRGDAYMGKTAFRAACDLATMYGRLHTIPMERRRPLDGAARKRLKKTESSERFRQIARIGILEPIESL